MRHLLLLLLACTLLACSSSTDPEPKPGLPEPYSKDNFLPLVVGNTWTYERNVRKDNMLQRIADAQISIEYRQDSYLTNYIVSSNSITTNMGEKFAWYKISSNVTHLGWGTDADDEYSKISRITRWTTIVNGHQVFGTAFTDSVHCELFFPTPSSAHSQQESQFFDAYQTYEWTKPTIAIAGDDLYENCMKCIIRTTETTSSYAAYREEWFWKPGLGIVQITLYKNDEIQEQWNLKNAVLK